MGDATLAVLDALAGITAGTRVPPWTAWLLCALARQVARQRFALRVRDAFGLSKRRQRDEAERGWRVAGASPGEIPAMPGWRYSFHGGGLLMMAPDGEKIDFDFLGDHDPEGRTVDAYFFVERLDSLRSPAFPEARLRALVPSDDGIEHLCRTLRATGDAMPARYGVRLLPELEARAEELEGVPFEQPEVRRAFSARFGDAEHLGGEAALAARRARRAFWARVGRWPWSSRVAKNARREVLAAIDALPVT